MHIESLMQKIFRWLPCGVFLVCIIGAHGAWPRIVTDTDGKYQARWQQLFPFVEPWTIGCIVIALVSISIILDIFIVVLAAFVLWRRKRKFVSRRVEATGFVKKKTLWSALIITSIMAFGTVGILYKCLPPEGDTIAVFNKELIIFTIYFLFFICTWLIGGMLLLANMFWPRRNLFIWGTCLFCASFVFQYFFSDFMNLYPLHTLLFWT